MRAGPVEVPANLHSADQGVDLERNTERLAEHATNRPLHVLGIDSIGSGQPEVIDDVTVLGNGADVELELTVGPVAHRWPPASIA